MSKALAFGKANIEKWRAARLSSLQVTYEGKQFNADPLSIQHLMLYVYCPVGTTVAWRTADNSIVTLDHLKICDLLRQISAEVAKIHARAFAAKEDLHHWESLDDIIQNVEALE